jgi:TolB protein
VKAGLALRIRLALSGSYILRRSVLLKSWIRWIGLPVVAAMLWVPTPCRGAYNYIDITNPSMRKVPLAVPYFKAMTPGDAAQISRDGADYMASSLNFTDYFKIIDRGAYLVAPDKIEIVAPQINFKNWTAIGAELLITGGVRVEQNQIEMELRLYDTFKQQLLVGKLYKGIRGDERRIIRRFCSEVIYSLTGKWGIFESRIAFTSTGTGHKEIYICDYDGSNPVQWTHHNSISLSPAWSSDGKFLAYTSYFRGNPDLYIKSLGQGPGAVVAKKGINISPESGKEVGSELGNQCVPRVVAGWKENGFCLEPGWKPPDLHQGHGVGYRGPADVSGKIQYHTFLVAKW